MVVSVTAPREPFFPQHRAIRVSDQPVTVRNLGTVEYQEAWDLQVQLAEQRARDACEDTFLVVEHPSIYTAGKITQAQDLPRNSLPVINVDRGGRITWHGAGQLVVYPIIKLAEPIDVVEYVRRLELATVQTVRTLGLSSAGRIDGRSGVWVPASVSPAAPGAPAGDRKLAAIGIRVSRGVTSHGLALNCNNTLDYYTHITPCGISDAGVSTLSLELGQDVSPDEVHSELISNLSQALAGKLDVPNAVVGQASNPTKISKTATKMGAVKAADPKS